jgi:hypothetical protein
LCILFCRVNNKKQIQAPTPKRPWSDSIAKLIIAMTPNHHVKVNDMLLPYKTMYSADTLHNTLVVVEAKNLTTFVVAITVFADFSAAAK